MYYENVGSPALLIDTNEKFYSNCGSRDCIRSPTINETPTAQGLRVINSVCPCVLKSIIYNAIDRSLYRGGAIDRGKNH